MDEKQRKNNEEIRKLKTVQGYIGDLSVMKKKFETAHDKFNGKISAIRGVDTNESLMYEMDDNMSISGSFGQAKELLNQTGVAPDGSAVAAMKDIIESGQISGKLGYSLSMAQAHILHESNFEASAQLQDLSLKTMTPKLMNELQNLATVEDSVHYVYSEKGGLTPIERDFVTARIIEDMQNEPQRAMRLFDSQINEIEPQFTQIDSINPFKAQDWEIDNIEL